MKTFQFLFSGGQDSFLLFFLLCLKQNKQNCFILTINHQVQLQSVCGLFHLGKFSLIMQQVFLFTCLTLLITSENNQTEETLRKARYQVTFRFQKFYKSNFSITSHTFSDSWETFLFNFLTRNIESNLSNFNKEQKIGQKVYHAKLTQNHFKLWKKKPFRNNVNCKKNEIFSKILLNTTQDQTILIYRPIKTLSRSSFNSVCELVKLPLFVDRTNFSFSFSRNRIRRQLLLYIETFFLKNEEKMTIVSNSLFNLDNTQEKKFWRFYFFS